MKTFTEICHELQYASTVPGYRALRRKGVNIQSIKRTFAKNCALYDEEEEAYLKSVIGVNPNPSANRFRKTEMIEKEISALQVRKQQTDLCFKCLRELDELLTSIQVDCSNRIHEIESSLAS